MVHRFNDFCDSFSHVVLGAIDVYRNKSPVVRIPRLRISWKDL